jgi:RHS repeat-associated protein
MGTNAYGYAYDPIGNRLAVTNNAAALTYTANALNQYTNIADGLTLTPVYDLDGNMTNYNGWTFVWDGENRLVLASNAATVESNYYDYMSRRVQMIVNGVTNRFEYDGWNLASETTSTGVTNFYVWGIDLSGSLQGAGGIGGLMAVVLNGHAYHPVADANGNVTDYVATNGTVVAHREFDAFGNTIVATGSMVNDFNFWFSSKYQDQDTGLYYYGYRFLSTELGRWVNRDPITEGGGLNLNCFVNNNSLANVDANGLLILNPVNPGNGVPPYIISPPIPGYPGYTPPPPNPQPTPTPSSFALPNFAFGLATSYKVTGNIPAGPGAVTISVEVKVSDGTCCKDGAIKSVAKVTGSVSGGYVVGVGIQPLSYTWNANGSLGNIGNCPATGVGNWKWQVKFEIKVGVTQANCTYAGGSGWTCGAGFNSGSISWNATMSGTVGATADFYRLTFTPLF